MSFWLLTIYESMMDTGNVATFINLAISFAMMFSITIYSVVVTDDDDGTGKSCEFYLNLVVIQSAVAALAAIVGVLFDKFSNDKYATLWTNVVTDATVQQDLIRTNYQAVLNAFAKMNDILNGDTDRFVKSTITDSVCKVNMLRARTVHQLQRLWDMYTTRILQNQETLEDVIRSLTINDIYLLVDLAYLHGPAQSFGNQEDDDNNEE